MSKIITFSQKGNFKKTEKLFAKLMGKGYLADLQRYGEIGVSALKSATPKDTGKTADSWSYHIEETPGSTSIYWTNSNVNNGVNIAVILQYGHGTKNGGYVAGRDYINPAMQPVFDLIAEEAWERIKNNE